MALAEFILKAIASVIALIGAYLAIVKYLDEKRKANETAKVESQKPFSTKQQEIYFDLLLATSTIANRPPDNPKREEASMHFWDLFWGALPMVATQEVAIAADAFSVVLTEQKYNDVGLRNASMDLARACRLSLGEAWRFNVEAFDKSEASTAIDHMAANPR
jgi:hypothetical protein